MRLADLNPSYSRQYASFDPHKGGVDPLPVVNLCFDCPTCGRGRRMCIYVGTELADESKGRWHVDSLPQSTAWVDTLTVAPSIKCHEQMHGPKAPPCNAHFSIINGAIV